MTNQSITLKGGGDAGLQVNEDAVSVKGDIQVDTEDDDDYPDDYISVKNIYKRVEALEIKLNENADEEDEDEDDED